ncbi:MAG TPA: cytochrome c oxidase subunit II [Gammaproteobacteria bacterium]|nr:cytochrome c oxidase subunit II [Gammaproteobacteria bacterium]
MTAAQSFQPIDPPRPFALFPEATSTLAGQVDAVYFTMLGLCGLVILLVLALMTYFILRYRRGNLRADRTHRWPRWLRHRLEWVWITLPLLIFIAVFVWGGIVYIRIHSMPADALEIHAIGKQWMWKFQHPGGQREINELHVPVGRPIKLTLASQDVIHSFYVPAFRIKRDVVPGRYHQAWFEATAVGRYHLFCAEYCGTMHSQMRGQIVVLPPQEYADWLRRQELGSSLAAEGAALFRSYGCSGCHGANSSVRAPNLAGIYGRPQPLTGGGTVIVDDAYIRDSILLPQKQVVAGFEPIMPSFAGQIGEDDILKLIAFIKSLAAEQEIQP